MRATATRVRRPVSDVRPAVPAGVRRLSNLEYARTPAGALTLDLYLPEQTPVRPLPVVMWVHGGGWKSGTKLNCRLLWLAAEGFAIASIDVRLLHACEIEHELVEWGGKIAREEAAAAHGHDMPAHDDILARPVSTRKRGRVPRHRLGALVSCARITQMRYVYDFDEQAPGGRELLGGKGVGLTEMTALGVPVPAGFTITTDACRAYMAADKLVPDGLDDEVTDLTVDQAAPVPVDQLA